MASVKNIFDISGRAMAAQMIRLNTVASNLANSNNISTTSEGAYRPLKPIFKTIYSNKLQNNGMATVDAINVQELNREPERVYMPDHPKADEDGYVFNAAVNVEEEMVEMLEASRQYQNNIEVNKPEQLEEPEETVIEDISLYDENSGKTSELDKQDEFTPQLFSDEEASNPSSEDNFEEPLKSEDEEDFEIPAFLRKQKF